MSESNEQQQDMTNDAPASEQHQSDFSHSEAEKPVEVAPIEGDETTQKLD